MVMARVSEASFTSCCLLTRTMTREVMVRISEALLTSLTSRRRSAVHRRSPLPRAFGGAEPSYTWPKCRRCSSLRPQRRQSLRSARASVNTWCKCEVVRCGSLAVKVGTRTPCDCGWCGCKSMPSVASELIEGQSGRRVYVTRKMCPTQPVRWVTPLFVLSAHYM
jgi:hypothetical protein